MRENLQKTSRFRDGTTILGHGDSSADLTKLLPDSFTRTRTSIWRDL